jgi:hypothetical protein
MVTPATDADHRCYRYWTGSSVLIPREPVTLSGTASAVEPLLSRNKNEALIASLSGHANRGASIAP